MVHLFENPPAKYDDLKVLFLNCTLKRMPILSHMESLIKVAERFCQPKIIYRTKGRQGLPVRNMRDKFSF